MIQLSECLAPSRPNLIFTAAKVTPKIFLYHSGGIFSDANINFGLFLLSVPSRFKVKFYDATLKKYSRFKKMLSRRCTN